MTLQLNDSGKEKLQQQLFRKGLILEGMIKKRSPVYTGQYKALWETRKNEDGSVSIVNPQGDKGRALEYGGGAGQWPPLDELRQWVRRKIGPEDVDTVTYFIGEKIESQGINPQPHIRPAIREFKSREI